jgi:hypothetical protein
MCTVPARISPQASAAGCISILQAVKHAGIQCCGNGLGLTRAHTQRTKDEDGRAITYYEPLVSLESNNPVSNFHGRDIEGRTGKEMTHGQPKYNNCTVFFIEKSAIIGGDHKKKPEKSDRTKVPLARAIRRLLVFRVNDQEGYYYPVSLV